MERAAFAFCQSWLESSDRKPLVIRGARQVGKTWLVRYLAEISGRQLIEINFEDEFDKVSLFESNDPKEILLSIEAALNKSVDPTQCILFLDEIQAAPELLAKLRWFAEKMPELPVIAAGSLLEFILEKHTFSMPVGRINYCHLEPLSFEEFLEACKKEKLSSYLRSFDWDKTIPETIHRQLIDLFKEYILVGGLPAAVASWSEVKSLAKISQIHHDLISTYRDDFSKYNQRVPVERLDEVLNMTPKTLGNKFIYSRVNKEISTVNIKQALNLLTKARLCHKVRSSASNGVPIAAEINDKFFKMILLDVGLVSALLDLKLHIVKGSKDINLINGGGISEQVVGQVLRTLDPFYIEPHLYYWLREERGASSEVDYVIQYQGKIIPIEVKSGTTGSLKSLHYFMDKKKLDLALRINSDFPNKTKIDIKTQTGNRVHYQLISIPFYLIEQIYRLVD